MKRLFLALFIAVFIICMSGCSPRYIFQDAATLTRVING